MVRLVIVNCIIVSALAQSPGESEFFEKKVRPIFVKTCQACHNARLKTGGLDLSTPQALDGPRLLQALSYDDRIKMPPSGKLAPAELADIAAWVKTGAPWPGATQGQGQWQTRKHGRPITEDERKFWSFQPVRKPAPPSVKDTAWVSNDIDRFILAKLESNGLKPAPPAGKLTLLRRATFDLTGLPPTETGIREFLADNSPGAFKTVVDRLLGSPRYGERWGRHWLDVARYADSTGNDEDHRYPYAYRYRDYVIEAFNNDLPYDQFIKEQVAGDLLPAGPDGINKRGVIATGFLALGAKAIAQQDKKKMLYDVYDEQLDVVSKSILGVTLACARCHDHKFDPFQQKDYYSIINFFANTRSFKDAETHVSKLLYIPLVPRSEYQKYQEHQEKLGRKKMERDDIIEQERERYSANLAPRIASYMLATRNPDAGKDLDPAILKKWVKYLANDWRMKPHLEGWQKAGSADVALAYQRRSEEQLEKWNKKIGDWRREARKALMEMNMPPRPRPMFNAEEDGFFHDIFIARGGPFALGRQEQDKIFSAETKQLLARLAEEEEALKKIAPPEPEMACGVQDEEKPVRQAILVRGDYNNLGEDAPKAFPEILRGGHDPAPAANGSGRLALAEWLANAGNTLTSRVIVNRIWQRHFSQGIVRTPDNFGRMGERPSHPELLDYLAASFVEGGWSIKSIHRMILMSSAYRMSSDVTPEANRKDPGNRLLSRFERRRLDVEEIRDGLLSIDGTIDLEMGGTLQKGFGTDSENSQDRISINPDKQKRRTVYMPLRRANLPAILNLFDFGDATTVTGKRVSTNVAPQALFMMNSDFLTERSAKLARDLSTLDASRRIEAAYLRILNRQPAPGEVDAGLTYVNNFKQKYSNETDAWQSMCRILMGSNDFIYVD
jgi:cytochrome c553